MNQADPLIALIEWGRQAWKRIQEAKGEGAEEIDDLLASADPLVREQAKKILALNEDVRAKMSPPGALNLPPMLEARRLQYGITDGAFRGFPLGERVVVWQMPVNEKSSGGIYRPDSTRDRETAQSPRCILVGAGLAALDILRSNGIGLGHIVRTIAYAPLRLEADTIAGKSTYVLPMNCGDIVDSEDTQEMVRSGQLRVKLLDGQYVFCDDAGVLDEHPKNPYVNSSEW